MRIERVLSVLQPNAAVIYELERNLEDSSARVRIAAADRLSQMGATAARSVPLLVKCLKHDNVTVRRAAVGDARAVVTFVQHYGGR